MALFKKGPGSLTELCNHAGSLGGTIGQVQAGTMPPDFLQAVLDGTRDQVHKAFAQAAEEAGSDKALKRAQQSARISAEAWVRPNSFVEKGNLNKVVDGLIEEAMHRTCLAGGSTTWASG